MSVRMVTVNGAVSDENQKLLLEVARAEIKMLRGEGSVVQGPALFSLEDFAAKHWYDNDADMRGVRLNLPSLYCERNGVYPPRMVNSDEYGYSADDYFLLHKAWKREADVRSREGPHP